MSDDFVVDLDFDGVSDAKEPCPEGPGLFVISDVVVENTKDGTSKNMVVKFQHLETSKMVQDRMNLKPESRPFMVNFLRAVFNRYELGKVTFKPKELIGEKVGIYVAHQKADDGVRIFANPARYFPAADIAQHVV